MFLKQSVRWAGTGLAIGLTLAFAVSLSIVREAAEGYCKQEPFDIEALNQNISNMVRISQRIGIDPKVVDVTPDVDGLAEGDAGAQPT